MTGDDVRAEPVPAPDGTGAPSLLGTEAEDRITAATLSLVARWGVRKTTLADVAREAGCSRATVYRAFPGGKQELFMAVGRRELDRFFARLVARVGAAASLEDALTVAVVEGSRGVAEHAALNFLLTHEPEVVLPFLGFHEVDRLYRAAAAALGPAFERFVPTDAAWTVEWLCRVVLSYSFTPAPDLDLCRPDDARRVVRQFLLPALEPVSQPEPALLVHS